MNLDKLIVEQPKSGPPITVAEVKLRLLTLGGKMEQDGEYARQFTVRLALETIEKLQALRL